jgi:competence protein ComEA
MLKKILAVLLMLCAAVAMAAVDVNKATDAELDGIKGIGPVTTKLITAERKKGEFKNWQDFIDRVKGVGEKSAVKLSENGLTVNGQSFKGVAAKEAKADAKADKKAEKADAKADSKEAKADAKADKKAAKAEAKAEKKEAKAVAKADSAKPAASAASAAKK